MGDPAESIKPKQEFGKLLFGFSVSMFGSRLTTVAYPLLILSLTGSPVIAGVAVFVSHAPGILFYMPAGALVDHWDPRKTMLRSEIGRGLAIALIVTLLLFHIPNVALVMGAAVVEESLEILSTLAERRYVGLLPGKSLRSKALMQTEARTHFVASAGRPFGALLFEILRVLPFLADFCSFVVSVIMLCAMGDKKLAGSPKGERPRVLAAIFDGINVWRKDGFIYVAIWLTAFMTLVSQALIMIVLVDFQKLHLPDFLTGLVLAGAGCGGALGALIGSRVYVHLPTKYSSIKIQLCIWTAGLLALALASLVTISWLFAAIGLVMFGFGFAGAVGNIDFDSYVASVMPSNMLARVTSVDRLSTFAACAVGPAVGGILIGSLGTRLALWALFALALIVVGLVVRPVIRRRVAQRRVGRQSAVRASGDQGSPGDREHTALVTSDIPVGAA